MKKLAAFFAAKSDVNLVTQLERQRMEKTMPGETGSLASLRYAGIAC